MPSAITPTVEQSKSRFTRLLLERKTGFRLVKTVHMVTSPTMTGNDPRSPEPTRSRTPRLDPATPVAWLHRLSQRSSTETGAASVQITVMSPLLHARARAHPLSLPPPPTRPSG